MFEILLLLLSQLIFRKICRILFETIQRKYIYIYISIYLFQKSIFPPTLRFPQLRVSLSYGALWDICTEKSDKSRFRTKEYCDTRSKTFVFVQKYVEKQCLNIFSPPPSIFSSFLIEEIARPSSKVNRVCHAFLQQRSRTVRQLPSTQLSPTDRQT